MVGLKMSGTEPPMSIEAANSMVEEVATFGLVMSQCLYLPLACTCAL